MEITIQENLQSTLTRLATEQNISVEQYIQNHMEAHLFSAYKSELIDIINRQPMENLQVMRRIADPAIEVVNAKIAEDKAFEQAEIEKAVVESPIEVKAE